ncbi:hypothetical protein, partial [Acidithiobacillus sp.]
GRRKLTLRVRTVRLPDAGFRQEQRRLRPKSRQNTRANCRIQDHEAVGHVRIFPPHGYDGLWHD